MSALMAARAIGWPIIAVDIHDNRFQLATELGATYTISWIDTHSGVPLCSIIKKEGEF
ncbi:hypothetical protein ACFO25_13930 [Paenactinomyces guangxiensis]|uniref:hypothetical protein n=1 Tax=Paenactinomyces guangxiensis TaxID=1490290 RepID=UPI0035A923F4